MKKVNATKENINRLVEEWHNSESDMEVHEYLGLTFEQYPQWVENGKFSNDLKCLIKKDVVLINGYVVRGKNGSKFFSVEKETFGQETVHDTIWQANAVKEQFEKDFPNEEFEIHEI